MKVLTEPEIHARYHIAVERYNKTISIELATLRDLVQGHVLPALETQLKEVLEFKDALTQPEAKTRCESRVKDLESLYGNLLATLGSLSSTLNETESGKSEEEMMKILADVAIPISVELRKLCDQTEMTIADKHWPLPKYRELLFSHALS
jgi:glutamine synthetase